MKGLVFANIFVVPAVSASSGFNHGYKSSEQWLPRIPVITMATGEELVGNRDLPASFDWRDVNGVNFVTSDLNQHQPKYCGACWIHGTSSMLNDRIKILRKGKFPDVILSRQALMNCIPDPSGQGPPPGCGGGDPWMIHNYMHHHRVPDETCLGYAAENMECSPKNYCRNCFRKLPIDPQNPFQPGPCFGEPNYIGYGVKDFGQIKGEAAMKKEIYARGPISCSGVTSVPFVFDYAKNPGVLKDGVYRDGIQYNESDIDHQMEITGWGETADGEKYWVVRNSWGTYWGLAGWFLLERGSNALKIEEHCDWAVPDFDDLDRELLNMVQGDYWLGPPGLTRNVQINTSADPKREVALSAVWGDVLGHADEQSRNPVNSFSTAMVSAFVGGLMVWAVPRLFSRRVGLKQPELLG